MRRGQVRLGEENGETYKRDNNEAHRIHVNSHTSSSECRGHVHVANAVNGTDEGEPLRLEKRAVLVKLINWRALYPNCARRM